MERVITVVPVYMEGTVMYDWLIFLHVLGVLGFLTAHGAAVAISFRVRGERDAERIRALLDLSRGMTAAGSVFLLVFLASGIAAGFMGNWWGHVWIWASLGLLVLIGIAMNVLGTRPLNRIREMTRPTSTKKADLAPALDISTDQQVASVLAATHPVLLTVVGGGGVALILWLMMFKPF
jgi:hypothetical protein